MATDFNAKSAAWRAIDPYIPAAAWTPEQKAINDAIVPIMQENADRIERLGRQSGNPIFEDLAALAAQYDRGFALTIPTYQSNDNYVAQVATLLAKGTSSACAFVA